MQFGKCILDDGITEIMVEMIHDLEDNKEVLKGYVYELKDPSANEFDYEGRYQEIPSFLHIALYKPEPEKEIEDWAEEVVQRYQECINRKK